MVVCGGPRGSYSGQMPAIVAVMVVSSRARRRRAAESSPTARGDAGCAWLRACGTAGRASERMRITLFVMAPRRPRAAGGRCSITLAYPGTRVLEYGCTGVEFLEFYAYRYGIVKGSGSGDSPYCIWPLRAKSADPIHVKEDHVRSQQIMTRGRRASRVHGAPRDSSESGSLANFTASCQQ